MDSACLRGTTAGVAGRGRLAVRVLGCVAKDPTGDCKVRQPGAT